MTIAPDDQPRRHYFSTLSGRLVIASAIGFSLSMSSFVADLHMGKDLIAYSIAELSKIEGWADAVKAVTASCHGALEWWREFLRNLLLSLSPALGIEEQWTDIAASLYFVTLIELFRWKSLADIAPSWRVLLFSASALFTVRFFDNNIYVSKPLGSGFPPDLIPLIYVGVLAIITRLFQLGFFLRRGVRTPMSRKWSYHQSVRPSLKQELEELASDTKLIR